MNSTFKLRLRIIYRPRSRSDRVELEVFVLYDLYVGKKTDKSQDSRFKVVDQKSISINERYEVENHRGLSSLIPCDCLTPNSSNFRRMEQSQIGKIYVCIHSTL